MILKSRPARATRIQVFVAVTVQSVARTAELRDSTDPFVTELVWTLTSHGKTERAYASLRPEYVIDRDLEMANSAGSPGRMPSTNQGPAVKIEGETKRIVNGDSSCEQSRSVSSLRESAPGSWRRSRGLRLSRNLLPAGGRPLPKSGSSNRETATG
jgi:hypothetical protein